MTTGAAVPPAPAVRTASRAPSSVVTPTSSPGGGPRSVSGGAAPGRAPGVAPGGTAGWVVTGSRALAGHGLVDPHRQQAVGPPAELGLPPDGGQGPGVAGGPHHRAGPPA